MVHCVVEGCKSRSDVHGAMSKNVHFHRIPKDPTIREKWMRAINIQMIKNSSRVCSLHFNKTNYHVTPHGLHKLIGSPAPTLNLEPKHEKIDDDSTDTSENDDKLNCSEKNISHSCQSQESCAPTLILEPKHEKIDDDSTDTSENDDKLNVPNVDCSEKNISHSCQSQQSCPNEIEPNVETYVFMEWTEIKHELMDEDDTTHICEDKAQLTDSLEQTANVPGSSSTKVAETMDQPADSKVNEEMLNEQFTEQTVNVKHEDVEDNISADKKISNEADTQTPHQTENVPGSLNKKTRVVKYIVTTPLERRLIGEITKLKELCQKRKEGMECLLQQNRRLLKRITFLEEINYNRQKK